MKYRKCELKMNVALTVLAILISANLSGQKKVLSIDLAEQSRKDKLEVTKSLTQLVDGNKHGVSCKGIVWIKDLQFSTGVIEVDLRGKDVFQQSFLGIAFHGVDTITYDAVYFRPFNFNAEDSVRKIHAVQYVSAPDLHWDKLREKFNGQYEKGITNAPPANDWFHVRIEIGNKTIKTFVNGSSLPSLVVDKLNNRTGGRIGLWSTKTGVDGDFANLKIIK